MDHASLVKRRAPIFGTLSVTLTPVALLFVFFASALAEALVGWAPYRVARLTVLISLFFIVAGVACGITGWVGRERHLGLPVMGWLSTVCITGLLAYFDKDG